MARDITIRYVGDSSSAERAARRVGAVNDRMSSKFSRLGDSFKKIGIAASVGLAGAGALAVKFGMDFVKAAEDANKVGMQTMAVITSTGMAAKVSTDDIQRLSQALSMKAGIDDELIQSGANVLLTFTNIRNEVGKGNNIFDQATTAALDMSVALGQDMQSSVIQLGKALNDPIKGMTALRRVGVAFSQSQVDMITKLVKSGDVLGAQKIILKELATEFGGSAEAQATASGKMSVAWGNLQEKLGEKLLPLLEKFSTWLMATGIPAIEAFALWVETKLIPAIQGVVRWFREDLIGAIDAIAGKFTEAREGVATTGSSITNTFQGVSEAVRHAMNVIRDVISVTTEAIKIIWNLFGQTILGYVNAVWTTIAGIIRGFLTSISGLIKTVLAIINGDWGRAWEGIKQIFRGIWQAIYAILNGFLILVKAALSNAWALIKSGTSAAWTGIKDVISGAWSSIREIVKASAKWVFDHTIGVFGALKRRIGDIWGSIQSGLKSAWNSITGAVRSAINSVIGIINGLIGGINKVLSILPGMGDKTIGKIGTIGAPKAPVRGGTAGGSRPTGRDVPPQIAHLLGHGSQDGTGDIPGSGLVKKATDVIGDIAGFVRKGAAMAVFAGPNKIAEAALNGIPWKFARDLGQGARQWFYDWVKGEDNKLPDPAAGPGGGSARGLVGYAAQYMPMWKSMFPWMTIGGWRARGSVPGSDHPKGKALDLMTGSGAVANQIISTFLGQAGAKYWIWNRQFASAAGGWRPRGYSGPSPHTDHVHLSYFHNGGQLREDITGIGHRTGRFYGMQSGENVLPRGVSGGTYAPTINIYTGADPQQVVEAIQRYERRNGKGWRAV